jgi:beta-phosphoglucomutase-like phosphatase (HAD superfamily)
MARINLRQRALPPTATKWNKPSLALEQFDPAATGSPAMISSVIFDVDGTLAETEEYHRRAFNEAFDEAGLDWRWDEPLYRKLLKVTGGKERILHYIDILAPSPRLEAGKLLLELHVRKTEIYTGYVEAGAIPLRAGVGSFIEAAAGRGLSFGIATTTSMPNVATLLESAFGPAWRKLFPVVAAGDMVARKKPAPDVYHLALKMLRRPAADCVAIEDSRNGVLSACAAGIRVIAVRSAYTSDDDLSGASIQLPDCCGLDMTILGDLDHRTAIIC